MTWRRTVYCRNCGASGHNRRGCPSLSPAQKDAYRVKTAARTCSWCGLHGHNKTSCVKRKSDRAAYVEKNAAFRKEILGMMRREGLGIGALVTNGNPKENRLGSEGLTAENMHIVTDIRWEDIQERWRVNRVIETHTLGDRRLDGTYDGPFGAIGVLSLPPVTMDDDYRYDWYNACVISRVKNPDDIVPPVDWLKGESGINKYF